MIDLFEVVDEVYLFELDNLSWLFKEYVVVVGMYCSFSIEEIIKYVVVGKVFK